MGAWGAGIFDNDRAADLRDRWNKQAADGGDPASCRDAVLRWFADRDVMGLDVDGDGPYTRMFFDEMFMVLGALCLPHDVLTEQIRQRALRGIETEDLSSWNPSSRGARTRALNALWLQLRDAQICP